MIIIDEIIFGFYFILGNTIYKKKTESDGFTAREHGFLFTWLTLSMCIQLIASRVWFLLFNKGIPLSIIIIFSVIILILLFVAYFRKNRFEKTVQRHDTVIKKVLSLIITITCFGSIIYFYLV